MTTNGEEKEESSKWKIDILMGISTCPPYARVAAMTFMQTKKTNLLGPKGGARSELYYTAQIAVTCSQINCTDYFCPLIGKHHAHTIHIHLQGVPENC